MPLEKLTELLDNQGVKYTILTHSRAYTAQEVAATVHVPGIEMAKTVMVKVDGKMAMAVVPASRKIDFERIREKVSARKVELAEEKEFQDLFPDCEVGAMPPFGNLYGIDVYVDKKLAEDDEIAFNSGSHTEVTRLHYSDFEKLVHPRQIDFSLTN
jgi:Ala-tRNA(Pro) deacylase